MSKNRFIFSDDIVLTNQKVGIGTSFPSTTLHVVGDVRSSSFEVAGISTFTQYSGYNDSLYVVNKNLEIQSINKGDYNALSSEIKINSGITLSLSGDATIASGEIPSLTVEKDFSVPSGVTTARESFPEKGSLRFNQDLNTLEFYTGVEWRQVNSFSSFGGDRGIFAGGYTLAQKGIQYVQMSSLGNSQYFGELTIISSTFYGCSSSTRGLFGARYSAPVATYVNTIDYITISSAGNAIDFGDMTYEAYGSGSSSSSTRGIFAGGQSPTGYVNNIEYVQISTTGNALDFGDLSTVKIYTGGSQSPTRCVFAGGGNPAASSRCDYITTASKGNSIYFGDLSRQCFQIHGASNATRAVYALGETKDSPNAGTTELDYMQLQSLGNSVDFGDLMITDVRRCSNANGTRVLIAGGSGDLIEYVTISTTGNAQYFGDLSSNASSNRFKAGVSNCHGGLGGF